MWTRVLAALVLVLGMSATMGRADDKPLDRTELDKRLVKIVYESALLGTDAFNKGNHEGCFRLYQGTLMAVQPLLDHRPKLMLSVKERMEKAKMMDVVKGAFELRAALDDIQNDVAPKDGVKKSLWDRLGGEKGVRKIVQGIGLAVTEDKRVNFLRVGIVKPDLKPDLAKLEQRLVEWISLRTGGPMPYTGKDMKTAHAGMKITSEEFEAFRVIVLDVLKKNNVSDDDIKEVMKAMDATKPDIVEVKGKP